MTSIFKKQKTIDCFILLLYVMPGPCLPVFIFSLRRECIALPLFIEHLSYNLSLEVLWKIYLR